MRVNIYAEEMTGRVEIVEKTIDGRTYTAVRFPLQLPASYVPADTVNHHHTPTFRPATVEDTEQAIQFQAPFIHRPGDDDSSAVTFWGKRDLRRLLQLAIDKLDAHYAAQRKADSQTAVTDGVRALAVVDEESLSEDQEVGHVDPANMHDIIAASENGAAMAHNTTLRLMTGAESRKLSGISPMPGDDQASEEGPAYPGITVEELR